MWAARGFRMQYRYYFLVQSYKQAQDNYWSYKCQIFSILKEQV